MMESETGELLTVWTVRLTVVCYLLRLFVDATEKQSVIANKTTRWSWTIGCILFLIHVTCAFRFYHNWSHVAAYHHTAKQTADVVGINWGGGIYFNYLFIAIWIADVIAWWRIGDIYRNQHRIYWSIQIIFAFMFINATVVFGPPFWKWIGLVTGVGLLAVWFVCRQRSLS